jgi:chromosome segregation ATPase
MDAAARGLADRGARRPASAATTRREGTQRSPTITDQIDKAWNELEPLVEQYNEVHGELQANQAKAAALRQQFQPLQQQVDAAMSKVSDIAVQAYKGGPTSALDALLAGSPASAARTPTSPPGRRRSKAR